MKSTKTRRRRANDMLPVKDAESLQNDLGQLKKKYATLKDENTQLKSKVQRMSVHLRKKDKQIQHVLSVKIVGMADKSNDTILSSQLKELKNEMRSISRLTDKVSELEESLHSKDEELKLLKSSMKFTLIKELQIEAQTYFNEARRMKKMLDKKIFKKHVKNNRALRESEFEELARLREEIKVLRREKTYLKNEKELDDQSFAILQRLRNKMMNLQSEIHGVNDHLTSIDQNKGDQHRLAQVLSNTHMNSNASHSGSNNNINNNHHINQNVHHNINNNNNNNNIYNNNPTNDNNNNNNNSNKNMMRQGSQSERKGPPSSIGNRGGIDIRNDNDSDTYFDDDAFE